MTRFINRAASLPLMLAFAIVATIFAAAPPALAADLTITASSVLPASGAVLETGTAGEAVTAGQALYKKAADGKWYKADCNSATAEVRVARAIGVVSASAGAPVVVQKAGNITIGATVAAGTVYFLSGTAGGIRPAADNTTGDYPQVLGMGVSTTAIQLNFALASASAL